ncbi:hypothetical protein Hanom_Chr04g00291451 [Helianthus anomalus]
MIEMCVRYVCIYMCVWVLLYMYREREKDQDACAMHAEPMMRSQKFLKRIVY